MKERRGGRLIFPAEVFSMSVENNFGNFLTIITKIRAYFVVIAMDCKR